MRVLGPHAPSHPHVVARVQRDLPGDDAHRFAATLSPGRVDVGIVLERLELVIALDVRLRRDLLMLGKLGLASDAGVCRILRRLPSLSASRDWRQMLQSRARSSAVMSARSDDPVGRTGGGRMRAFSSGILVIARFLGADRMTTGNQHEFVVRRQLHHLAWRQQRPRGLLSRHHQMAEPGAQPMTGIVLHRRISVAVPRASETRLAVRSSLVAKLTRTWQLSRIELLWP